MSIQVPIEVISKNMTDECVLLMKEHQEIENKLDEICNKQSKLFQIAQQIIHPTNKYYRSYTYDYEDFKSRKAWRDALLLQESSNQIVNNEAILQEMNAKYVEVKDKIRAIYKKCGVENWQNRLL